ncbi:MAG: hypothetical protein NC453_09670 [Muribaculum sp.]|nr:hypothetical protein [Muribaculum sp.]
MKKLITSNPSKRHQTPFLAIANFEKHIGRKLSNRDRAIISKLECRHFLQQIGKKIPLPILIIDPPGQNSSRLLIEYLNYSLDILDNPDIQAVVFTPGAQNTILNLAPYPKKKQRIRHSNYRKLSRFRGQNIGFMLLLNLEDAEECSPLYGTPGKFSQLCSTLFPMQSPFGFLILHIALSSNANHETKLIRNLPSSIQRHIATRPKPPDPTPPVTIVTIPIILRTIGRAISTHHSVGTLHGASSPSGITETSNPRRT